MQLQWSSGGGNVSVGGCVEGGKSNEVQTKLGLTKKTSKSSQGPEHKAWHSGGRTQNCHSAWNIANIETMI